MKYCIFLYILLLFAGHIQAQTDPLPYVNPFIGTTRSNVFTRWGSGGGTYPGAVAPWGAVQLTPETHITDNRGYDYRDSSIYFFSCLYHLSGYPNGSAGHLYVMPVNASHSFRLNTYHRPFLHNNEEAHPGYYRVVFPDDNTQVEATAGERTGIFRFTFPAHEIPKIFIGDAGKLTVRSNHELTGTTFNNVLRFDKDYTGQEEVSGGWIFTFAPQATGATVIQLQIGVSSVSTEGTEKNLAAESSHFDELKEATRNKWRTALSVVEIEDTSENNKTVFYSALYHALLVPWINSDVDGKYKGADGKIHQTTAGNAYKVFSPWDTFRSLHPLLCLLFPEQQQQMIESMLDIYRQTGYLPTASMTGNHAIAIITDSWLKRIKVSDSVLAFNAMKKSLIDGPFSQPDMASYRQQGYVPFLYPESVTRTVEYAYDDWSMAQFARVMHNDSIYNRCLQAGFNYRKLFNAQELFLLPRCASERKLHPGTFGYKEGDAWVYSYFAPQNGKDLVNIMGGDELFTARLDSAFTHNLLVFDNETMFHVPYLFNYTNAAFKTQDRVQKILRTRFSATPGGLPGNDDLGSMSSWWLFSAMGIYPFCPGRPVYAISSPLFKSVTIHLSNGKQWVIKADNVSAQNRYIRSLTINGQPYHRLWLSHETMLQGGNMYYIMDSVPHTEWVSDTSLNGVSETVASPDFHLVDYSLSKSAVVPDEPLWARFVLQNKGTTGTKKVTLLVNGKVYGQKNCLVPEQATVTDSIPFRLYPFGKDTVQIDSSASKEITVIHPNPGAPVQPVITNMVIRPLLYKGKKQRISFTVKNTDGEQHLFNIPILVNDSVMGSKSVTLQAGAVQTVSKHIQVKDTGLYTLRVSNASEMFKVVSRNKETALLDIELPATHDNVVIDRSGFHNNGRIICQELPKNSGQSTNRDDNNKPQTANHRRELLRFNTNCYVEIPNSLSLDSMGETITMMLYVYPIGKNKGLTDLFTKGDYNVLQVSGNKRLTFFAGGWGRGECRVALPADWFNHWHHIAGVCDGRHLYLYIDGELKETVKLQDRANLSVSNKWTIGRNEEFPGQRIFNGYIDRVKLFAAPLTGDEILEEMKLKPGHITP